MSIYDLKIFTWVDKQIVDEIITSSPKEKYSIWDIIISQWEDSNWKWYIISSWEVEVLISWEKVAKLWVWEIFWEIALLNEEERTATIKSTSDLEVIIITQESLIELVNSWNTSINKDIMDRIEQNLKNN